MDNPKEIKNPELILAMQLLKKNNNDENMLKVLTEALKSQLILPVNGQLEGKMQFHAVSGSDGKIYQVVYADSLSFNEAFGASNQNGLVANFMDLADLVINEKSKVNGFVINPGKEEIIFGQEMIQAIVNQLIAEGAVPGKDGSKASSEASSETPSKTSSSSNVRVGDPESLPEGLGNAAIEFASSFEEVFKVTIQLMQYEGEDRPKWLFIVDHNGDSDELFGYLGKAVGPYLSGLDIVMVDGNSPFGKQASNGKVPVYAK